MEIYSQIPVKLYNDTESISISAIQKDGIYKLIVAGDHNKNSLSSKFNIGISTINNIWKEFGPQIEANHWKGDEVKVKFCNLLNWGDLL